MKKSFTLLLSFMSLHIFSQTYYPFRTDSATWTIVEYGYGTLPPETGTWHFGLGGDTVIDSYTYTKIYCNWGSLGTINPEPVFNIQTATLYGMFREDSTKKVWFRQALDTAAYIYYDFNLNLGDTFCFHSEPSGVLCHQVYLVDSILINGNYRRQIHFQYGGQEEVWVEGIGSLYDNWIGDWSFIGNIEWTLNCYREHNFHMYGTCNYPTSISEQNKETTSPGIFPNPVTDRLNVRMNSGEETEIIFYDIESRRLFSSCFTYSISINTERFLKGIYIYEIREHSGLIHKGKIVK